MSKNARRSRKRGVCEICGKVAAACLCAFMATPAADAGTLPASGHPAAPVVTVHHLGPVPYLSEITWMAERPGDQDRPDPDYPVHVVDEFVPAVGTASALTLPFVTPRGITRAPYLPPRRGRVYWTPPAPPETPPADRPDPPHDPHEADTAHVPAAELGAGPGGVSGAGGAMLSKPTVYALASTMMPGAPAA